MTTSVFRPPIVQEGSPGAGPLFSRVNIPRGMTVLKTGGVYSTVRYPSLDSILAAEAVYMGGHAYPLTDQEVTDLTAAGYGDNITLE